MMVLVSLNVPKKVLCKMLGNEFGGKEVDSSTGKSFRVFKILMTNVVSE